MSTMRMIPLLSALVLALTLTLMIALSGCQTKCPCPTTRPVAAAAADPKKAGDPADDDTETAREKEPQQTLYERMGGEATIVAVVDDLLSRAIADPALNFTRKGTSHEWQPTPENLALLKTRLIQFLGTATGGPQRYEGQDLRTSHRDMHLTAKEFNAFVKDCRASLEHAGVKDKERKEVLEILESARGSIVESK